MSLTVLNHYYLLYPLGGAWVGAVLCDPIVALPPAAVDTGLVPRHHHRTATEQSDRVETLPQESCEPKSRSLLVYVFCKRIRKHSQVVWHKLGFVC